MKERELRWRHHTEAPTERLTTALIAVPDETKEQGWHLLGDIYIWTGQQWSSESTGWPPTAEFRWLPEQELLDTIK